MQIDNIRQTMSSLYRADDQHVLDTLSSLLPTSQAASSQISRDARTLVEAVRSAKGSTFSIEALLQEYSLSTREGVLLMCLAEALLRVPDAQTIDELIADKILKGDWEEYVENGDSLLVHASAWGMLLTGKVVDMGENPGDGVKGYLKKAVSKAGEPLIRQSVKLAMAVMGKQFVLGETIEQALKRAQSAHKLGYRYSYDMLGEGARTHTAANTHFASYVKAIKAISATAKAGAVKSDGISVKISAIHPRYEFAQKDRAIAEIVPKLLDLAKMAKAADINFTVDAEEMNRLELSMEIIERVVADKSLDGWDGFGMAVQAYQKRTSAVIDWLIAMAKSYNRRFMIRLVKGAYWDSEIKHAHEIGVDGFPVYTRKQATDCSYIAIAKKMLDAREHLFPQFATHNAHTVAAIMQLAQDKEGFEFQRLHGMGDTLYDALFKRFPGYGCRIYAPVGVHEDLLAYLVRRLLENGANTSFVHHIVNPDYPIEQLIEHPWEALKRFDSTEHAAIEQASEIYGDERSNSQGYDIDDQVAHEALESKIAAASANFGHGYSVAVQSACEITGFDEPSYNPAKTDEVVGQVLYPDHESVERMLAASVNSSWANVDAEQRAAMVSKVGDLFERDTPELIALLRKEAGKTLNDAIAEVREAVDFCRYYGARAPQLTNHDALGVVFCIAPWNFPLAIFAGQVVAALAMGNSVLAKPAETTSLVGAKAVALMHEAGIPVDAIQLLPGSGKLLGAQLVPDERVAGIAFTGSTETAKWIEQANADRDGDKAMLIAETGGQNVMIVDSTALPEQVVDDVVISGFLSAGQRCSALRILLVQEEAVDRVQSMVMGAMDELVVGDPELLSTDIGPVIDSAALARLVSHAEQVCAWQASGKATLLKQLSAPSEGTFFGPMLCKLESIELLEREVFGPAVHIVSYKADELSDLIAKVKELGYGLTMGIHSRIDDRIEEVVDSAAVGNLYVNRNQVGAIVGSQPFGGMGKSGTGPKAGGPNYLRRFARMRGVDTHESSDQLVNALLEAELIGKDDVGRLGMLVDFYQQELSSKFSLPGATGEDNSLSFVPRGSALGWLGGEQDFALNPETVVALTIAALADNKVCLVSELKELTADQELNVLRFADILVEAGADFELCLDTSLDQLADMAGEGFIVNGVGDKQVARRVAKRCDHIVPILEGEIGDIDVVQMVHERSVSINLTASGGNTQLMSLGDH